MDTVENHPVKSYARLNLLQLATVSLYGAAGMLVAFIAHQAYGERFIAWLSTTSASAIMLVALGVFLTAACLAPSRKSIFFADAMLPLKTVILAGLFIPSIEMGKEVISPLASLLIQLFT